MQAACKFVLSCLHDLNLDPMTLTYKGDLDNRYCEDVPTH